MIFLLLGGLGGEEGEWEGLEEILSFFGGSQGLLAFIQGLLNAILEFLTGFPGWITGGYGVFGMGRIPGAVGKKRLAGESLLCDELLHLTDNELLGVLA